MEINVKNYSNDFHEFALQIVEDLKKLTSLPLELRTVEKKWNATNDIEKHSSKNTREFIDIKLEKSDYPMSIDLQYAFEYHEKGKEPEEVFTRALKDIELELSQEAKQHMYLHSNEDRTNDNLSIEIDDFEPEI